MTFQAYRGNAFEHTHENHAFNRLYDLLQAEWAGRDEPLYLWGNVFVEGRELDALVVKRNAIIVVDLKDYGGQLSFSENGRWTIDGVEVKGGNSVNPYQQIRKNKFSLLHFMKNRLKLESTPNLFHIAGLALFHQEIQFDPGELPHAISRWFHIADLRHAIRAFDAIGSQQIALSEVDFKTLIEAHDLPRYLPDGHPETVRLAEGGNSRPDTIQWSEAQQNALDKTNEWLADEKTLALVVEGMVSTGKRTLLRPFIEKISQTGQTALLIAPNSRIAQGYTTRGIECRSVYSLLYNSKPDGMIDGRAHHPVHLIPEDISGRVLVFVEAHLLGNGYFATDTDIYGSGYLLDDLLEALGDSPPKMLLIGDPFQLTRGDRELSLLNARPLEAKGHVVERVVLNEQIRLAELEAELLDFQKTLADGLAESHFNRLPAPGKVQVQEHRPEHDGEELGRELTTGHFNAVYVCGKNEIAQKVNQVTRQKYLGLPSMSVLAVGDKVDLHSRTPVLQETEDPLDDGVMKWLNSGEIATVEATEENRDTRSIRLKGRDHATVVVFAIAMIKVPGAGSVRIRYLPDYLTAAKPELSKDQVVAMQIWAREEAQLKLAPLKARVEELKKANDENYEAEKSRYQLALHQLMINDSYFNAARLRFAYAMTVHRAQGRKWQRVIINAHEPSNTAPPNSSSYFRWLYTATTCAEDQITLLKYPRLDPLSNAEWKPNQQCKIGPVHIRRQYVYEKDREVSESEKQLKIPKGFTKLQKQLVALLLSIHDGLKGSAWRVDKIAQHDYQEHYWFISDSGALVSGRFTYNTDYTVTNVAMKTENGSESSAEELWRIIEPKRTFKTWEVKEAVEALEARVERLGFKLLMGKETAYKAVVVLQRDREAIELAVNVRKTGMVSSVYAVKASDEAILALLESIFKG